MSGPKFKPGDMCIVLSGWGGNEIPNWLGVQVFGRVVVLSRAEDHPEGWYWSMQEPLTVYLHETVRFVGIGSSAAGSLCSIVVHEDNLQLVKRGRFDETCIEDAEAEEWAISIKAGSR